jgi:hypothetical protein
MGLGGLLLGVLWLDEVSVESLAGLVYFEL